MVETRLAREHKKSKGQQAGSEDAFEGMMREGANQTEKRRGKIAPERQAGHGRYGWSGLTSVGTPILIVTLKRL